MNLSIVKRTNFLIIPLLAVLALTSSCQKSALECDCTDTHSVDTVYISTTDAEGQMVSIQKFDVLPTNKASVNKKNLQKAIDWASASGMSLYVTPVENGYPVDGGLVLKKNVSLIGAHGPTGRGTVNSTGDGPTGSLFVITDNANVFLTVESATKVSGIQFYYPDQTHTEPSEIIRYPATIQTSKTSSSQGVTLTDLSFYGEFFAMDFRPGDKNCEQILIENCYGYPLSGQFIAIDKCYDIPRILHCHVNPANQREFGRSFTSSVIDNVVAQKKYSYWIDHTDNAVLMDVFTFGVYGGLYLGENTYGQLTSFNFDCVNRGIYRTGNSAKNRTWMISQGSIIANVGSEAKDIHPIILDGYGHTSITNVECFSGSNAALTTFGSSFDFVDIEGSNPLTVALNSCRMSGYVSDCPITVNNPSASIRAVSCVDASGAFFDFSL